MPAIRTTLWGGKYLWNFHFGFQRRQYTLKRPLTAPVWRKLKLLVLADNPRQAEFLLNQPPRATVNQTGPRGTTDWTRYEYTRQISADASAVIFGVFLAGNGIAWYDNLHIEVDGSLLVQGPAPFIGEPSPDQIRWILDNAIPLRTTDAGSGFDDLQRRPPRPSDFFQAPLFPHRLEALPRFTSSR